MVTVRAGEPTVPTALRPYVAGASAYDITGALPGHHIGMPSPTLTVIVPVGEPLRCGPAGAAPSTWSALVGGLHQRPVHVHHDGTQRGVQLDLTPLGARVLLGLPAAELTGELVALDELLLSRDRHLVERVGAADAWAERVDLVLAAVGRRLARDDGHLATGRAEVREAWRHILASRGRVPVHAVADDVGWSTRHLGQRFRDEYGLTPKTAARLARFDHSRSLLGIRTPLSDIAIRCGYADQAHLNRDWREFAGISPGRLEAEDGLAFFQDADS